MDGKLSPDEAALIIEHNEILSSGQALFLADLHDLFKGIVPPQIAGQMAYLKSSIKTLNWSSAIARQRIRPEPKQDD
jgi:hypothetical protein